MLVLCALVASSAGQANIQGQWSTLSTPIPVNPVHVALLSNGRVLVVAGSGNCPPSQSGCPSGAPYGASNGSDALLVDPVSGQIISQFSLSWDMFCNGMVVLHDGRRFINGGTLQYILSTVSSARQFSICRQIPSPTCRAWLTDAGIRPSLRLAMDG